MLGIDVSNHQGRIDWRKMKADGVDFAWVKATEGVNFTDPYFGPNLLGARQAGVPVGAYHYARPDRNSPEAEADRFLAVYRPKPGDLLPVLDFETNALLSRLQMTEWALRWLKLVGQALHGEQPILYTYPYFLVDRMDVTALRGCKLWYADYTGKPGVFKYRRFALGTNIVAQQYTSKGRVAGHYPVDLNYAASLGPLLYATKPAKKAKPLPGPVRKPRWFWPAVKEFLARRRGRT